MWVWTLHCFTQRIVHGFFHHISSPTTHSLSVAPQIHMWKPQRHCTSSCLIHGRKGMEVPYVRPILRFFIYVPQCLHCQISTPWKPHLPSILQHLENPRSQFPLWSFPIFSLEITLGFLQVKSAALMPHRLRHVPLHLEQPLKASNQTSFL